jgi:hypothetical protein
MAPKSTKRRTWLDKLPPRLRARLDAEIDCRTESLSAIYRRYNVVRYCMPRTFRLYGGERRRRLTECDRRRRAALIEQQRKRATGGPANEGQNADGGTSA